MKEIQFRAWDKKNKKMYYGYEPDRPNMIDFDGNLCITGAGNRDEYGGPTDYISGCDQENYILMRYTGQKDKEGNEIYEDDIVENYDFINAPFRFGIITFENDLGCWKIKSLDTQEVILVYLDFISSKRCKVIGNRWANPELLPEEGKND